MLKQILVGLVVAALGGTIIYFSASIADLFGKMEWFERNMGSTRMGYIAVGFVIIVVGFLILFGVLPLGQTITQVSLQAL